MMKCLVLSFIVVLFVMNVPSGYAEERRRLCGRRLSEVLSYYCQSNYQAPHEDENTENDIEKKSLKLTIPASNPVSRWIMQRDSVRLTRGVVDECCHTTTGCSKEQLLAYCG